MMLCIVIEMLKHFSADVRLRIFYETIEVSMSCMARESSSSRILNVRQVDLVGLKFQDIFYHFLESLKEAKKFLGHDRFLSLVKPLTFG